MSTSGETSFNPVVQQIVRDALLNCGAIDENEQPSAPLYTEGVFKLNAMVKALEATGLHVWTESEAILFLEPGQPRYVIGGSGVTANTSDADSWTQLTLAQPAALGATHLTLDVGEGLFVTAGQNIGVINNDGVTEWFTVSGAPVGDVVALSGPLLVSADVGNYALAYETKITRPLKVPNARLLTLNGGIETPMTILSRQGYMDLPNKKAPGTPTQWFFSPQRDTGLLYIWPVPVFSSWAVRFTWYRPLQDYLLPTDTSDFPQEWINPLMWNLSKEMAPGYGVGDKTWARIEKMADTYALLAISYDRESEPVQFGMDYAYGTERS